MIMKMKIILKKRWEDYILFKGSNRSEEIKYSKKENMLLNSI